MNAEALPVDIRLTEVQLRTARLRGMLPFYERALGLSVLRRDESDVVLGAPGQGNGFVHLKEDPEAVEHPQVATGLYHFAILYPTRMELAQALKRLILQNWSIEGASNHLVSHAIYLRDPDNNGIELYVDLPRSEWHWDGDQVRMATEPLDLRELLSLAAPELTPEHPPASTRLGHIHLHVGGLAEAERFFHEFLGFAVTQRSYPGALFFGAGGYHHHVGVNTWAGRTSPPPNSTGLVSYRFEVPGKDVLEDLEIRAPIFGYEVRKEAAAEGGEALRIREPSGSYLELVAVEPVKEEAAKIWQSNAR